MLQLSHELTGERAEANSDTLHACVVDSAAPAGRAGCAVRGDTRCSAVGRLLISRTSLISTALSGEQPVPVDWNSAIGLYLTGAVAMRRWCRRAIGSRIFWGYV